MEEKNHQEKEKTGSRSLKVKMVNNEWFVVKADILDTDTFLIGPYKTQEDAKKFVKQLHAK